MPKLFGFHKKVRRQNCHELPPFHHHFQVTIFSLIQQQALIGHTNPKPSHFPQPIKSSYTWPPHRTERGIPFAAELQIFLNKVNKTSFQNLFAHFHPGERPIFSPFRSAPVIEFHPLRRMMSFMQFELTSTNQSWPCRTFSSISLLLAAKPGHLDLWKSLLPC